MKVAVIGAGAAGLCCARHLSRYPYLFSFSVFEKADQVGGSWVYTDRTDKDEYGLPVHSSMYKGLKTNLPKEIMHFPELPFKEDLPSFVSHVDMLEYLKLYTTHFSLHKHIHFHTNVERVEPVLKDSPADSGAVADSGSNSASWIGLQDTVRWRVQSKDLKTGYVTEATYDAVLVCSGHYSKPHIPDIPGLSSFPGQVIHSHCFRTPDGFTGKRVLVVGVRASGADIIVQVAPFAESVYLVYHTNRVEYELPPNGELLSSITKINSNGTVHFKNGESRLVDDIILCTGYQYHLPFLTSESGIRIELGKRVAPLYKHMFNAVHPSMVFLGLNYPIPPFPFFHVQVQFIVSVLAGKTQLPPQNDMMKDCEEDYSSRLEQGLPHHHSHQIAVFPFIAELVQLASLEPLDPTYEKLYICIRKVRRYDALHYKKYDYTVTRNGDNEIEISRHLHTGETSTLHS